jgi:hypothetical protein
MRRCRTKFGDWKYPDYPHIPGAARYRKIARSDLTAEQKAAYSDAIRKAILAQQRRDIIREVPDIRPSCASGTWHNMADGSVGKAIRSQQREALLRAPDSIRAKRTAAEILTAYNEAMAIKRAYERAFAA